MPFAALADARGRTLQFKTCNDTNAGTLDTITLSFCGGDNDCIVGLPNAYNLRGELAQAGAWNQFLVPLEYAPTTMQITIEGNDGWCIEEVVWEGGNNLLGQGAKLYLDGDFGVQGCNYGVHIDTGWFFPCQSTWRFFNLQASDDFKYQVTVKSCEGEGASTVLASLCSESRCNDTIGDVVSFKLTSGGRGGSGNEGKWKTTQISADFNPVAMELSNDKGSSWCADEMAFNGYRLLSTNLSPLEHVLSKGKQRYFYNLQLLGNVLEDKAWEVATEAPADDTVSGGTATDGGGGGGEGGVGVPPLCSACGVRLSTGSLGTEGVSRASIDSAERAPMMMSSDNRAPWGDLGPGRADNAWSPSDTGRGEVPGRAANELSNRYDMPLPPALQSARPVDKSKSGNFREFDPVSERETMRTATPATWAEMNSRELGHADKVRLPERRGPWRALGFDRGNKAPPSDDGGPCQEVRVRAANTNKRVSEAGRVSVPWRDLGFGRAKQLGSKATKVRMMSEAPHKLGELEMKTATPAAWTETNSADDDYRNPGDGGMADDIAIGDNMAGDGSKATAGDNDGLGDYEPQSTEGHFWRKPARNGIFPQSDLILREGQETARNDLFPPENPTHRGGLNQVSNPSGEAFWKRQDGVLQEERIPARNRPFRPENPTLGLGMNQVSNGNGEAFRSSECGPGGEEVLRENRKFRFSSSKEVDGRPHPSSPAVSPK
eukprot:jgi/Undpi1/256/HiC_scaffold_1.g00253.m1